MGTKIEIEEMIGEIEEDYREDWAIKNGEEEMMIVEIEKVKTEDRGKKEYHPSLVVTGEKREQVGMTETSKQRRYK